MQFYCWNYFDIFNATWNLRQQMNYDWKFTSPLLRKKSPWSIPAGETQGGKFQANIFSQYWVSVLLWASVSISSVCNTFRMNSIPVMEPGGFHNGCRVTVAVQPGSPTMQWATITRWRCIISCFTTSAVLGQLEIKSRLRTVTVAKVRVTITRWRYIWFCFAAPARRLDRPM